MKVRHVMSTEVHTASEDTPYKELLERMLEAQISGMPVVNPNGVVVGMVTEADLIRKLAYGDDRHRHAALMFLSHLLSGHDPAAVLRNEGSRASEFMTQPVVSVGPDDDLVHAARVMLAHHVKSLLVLDGKRLVGLVARRDLLSIFDVADAEIASAVDEALRAPLSAPEDHRVTAAVQEGVVTLTGTVLHPSDLHIVTSLAQHVTGVVAVRSDVTAREPEPRLENLTGGFAH